VYVRDRVSHPYRNTGKISVACSDFYVLRQQTRRQKVLDLMVANITTIQSPLNIVLNEIFVVTVVPKFSNSTNMNKWTKFRLHMSARKRSCTTAGSFLPGLRAEFNSENHGFCVWAYIQSNGSRCNTSQKITCLVIGWTIGNSVPRERLSFLPIEIQWEMFPVVYSPFT
jgi:hypothetical protein